jgi:ABC-2 type transport system ATP-binding protein
MSDAEVEETEPGADEPAVHLDDVWVQYRLRHAHHYNLKRTLTNAVTFRREPPEVINALAGCSLTIHKGERVGIIGPNGSGKSTLLSVLAGLRVPSRGRAEVRGRVLALLGGPSGGLDPEQTGLENAIALGVRLGASPRAMERLLPNIVEFAGLGSRIEHPVYSYSSGMQVRLRFSTITALPADILIVDEGIGAADAEFNARSEERLESFYKRAGTLIMATHSADLIERFCHRRVELVEGRIASQWPPPRPQLQGTRGTSARMRTGVSRAT